MCTSGHLPVKLDAADDVTLLPDGDESAYGSETDRLMSMFCMNLELNALQAAEMKVDSRKDPGPLPPFLILV